MKFRLRLWFRLFALLTFIPLAGCVGRRRPKDPPVVPTVEPLPTPVSQLRLPPRGNPVTGFERLAGWEAIGSGGTATLIKNTDRPIWGSACAEIRYVPGSMGPYRVLVIPDESWRIRSPFNTLLLWIWHDGEAGLRKDHSIRILARTDEGEAVEWSMPYAPKKGWQMLHARANDSFPWPVEVEAIQWVLPDSVTQPQHLFLESMSIYQEVLGRIPQNVQYVRPYDYPPAFAPRRDNSVEVNFPSRPFAYRPESAEAKSLIRLERVDASRFRFTFESERNQLEYILTPAPGGPRVQVQTKGLNLPDLWRNFGVKSDEGPPAFRFARMDDTTLFLQYGQGLTYEIRLVGRTLQIEAESLSETITGLDLGSVAAPGGYVPEVIRLPFLRLEPEQRWPVFLVRHPAGETPVLVSCFPDWWYSMSGGYEPLLSTAERSGVSLGQLVYPPRWRGGRNMFRERVYFTVSDRLEDVLPTAASPRPLYRDLLTPHLWRTSARVPEWSQSWFPLSILPSNASWSDSLLSRTPAGDWMEHPRGGFVIKTGQLDEEVLPDLPAARDGKVALYLPELCSTPPWRYTDADVRMNGAGTYAQTWAEIGVLLQQAAAEWGGPVMANGGSEWLWSGFVAGFAPDFPHGLMELHPFLPHVAWRNILPVSQLRGLGEVEDFHTPGAADPDLSTSLDRLLGTMVAYGAVGRIPHIEDPLLRTMAERLQKALLPMISYRRSERIAYWSGERFLTASEAMQQGDLVQSQLYVRLDNQTEIWVNGDFEQIWELQVDGRRVRLSPFGFVVRGEDNFVFKGLTATGEPLAWVDTPDMVWISCPSQEVERSGVEVQGCLAVVPSRENGPVEILISEWTGTARIGLEQLGLENIGTVQASNRAGEPVQGLRVQREGPAWRLKGDPSIRRIQLYQDVRGRETNFLP